MKTVEDWLEEWETGSSADRPSLAATFRSAIVAIIEEAALVADRRMSMSEDRGLRSRIAYDIRRLKERV